MQHDVDLFGNHQHQRQAELEEHVWRSMIGTGRFPWDFSFNLLRSDPIVCMDPVLGANIRARVRAVGFLPSGADCQCLRLNSQTLLDLRRTCAFGIVLSVMIQKSRHQN